MLIEMTSPVFKEKGKERPPIRFKKGLNVVLGKEDGENSIGKSSAMKMSYKKLWKLLIDKDMNKTDLRKAAGISSSSLAKLGKDENVTTDVLLRICKALDCELDDIVEIERTEE